jgi:hypothetical protein
MGEHETLATRYAAVRERAAAQAEAAADDGRWGTERDAALDAAFEHAALAALAVPALIERAVRLKRIARRVVPRTFRPSLRRAARRLDALRAASRRA